MGVGIGKTSNMYAMELYDLNAPKTVFMAIALSFAMRLVADDLEKARALVAEEWRTLHQNGIVPQKPR